MSLVIDVHLLASQLCARVPGGTGRYTADVIQALPALRPPGARLTVVTSRRCSVGTPDGVGLRQLALPNPVLARLWERGMPPRLAAPIIHAPTLMVPSVRRGSLVVTVHDVVPWTHPETLTPRGVRFHERMMRRAVREASAIVCPTAATARAVTRLFSPIGRVEVIPPCLPLRGPAPDPADALLGMGLPPAFVLFVGTAEPRKGLETLVASMAQPAMVGLDLVVAGPPGWGDVQVADLARRHGVEGRVHVLGRVSDDVLLALYAAARALAVPSLAEGFGLPLLEGMAAGVPVVTSQDAALVEVGGGATLTVPYGDVDGLAEALARACADGTERADLVARGHRRAAGFNSAALATQLWQLYGELVV